MIICLLNCKLYLCGGRSGQLVFALARDERTLGPQLGEVEHILEGILRLCRTAAAAAGSGRGAAALLVDPWPDRVEYVRSGRRGRCGC